MRSTLDMRREQARLRSGLEGMLALADSLDQLDPAAMTAGLDQVVDFLELELGPHAAAEERVFYPRVAELLHEPGMTAGMLYDHREMRRLATELVEMRQESPAGEPAASELSAKLYAIYTLIRAHMNEEEVVYLSALDALLTPDEGRALFRRMVRRVNASRRDTLESRARRMRHPAGSQSGGHT